MNPTRDDNSSASAASFDGSSDEPQDDRLVAAVQEYMKALDSGQRPNRREFLWRYADIADELSECLDGLAFVNAAADEIPGAAPAPREGDDRHEIDLDHSRPLGDFRLIREIGRGGMGVVYEAIQLTLGRRVAVKVLPMAAALDSRHLERFRHEAQAAAQLHHTNIVPVYAVGCERSVHFYAMQLIEGQSLSEVIHDLRQLAPPVQNSPTDPGTAGSLGAPTSALTPTVTHEDDALTITWRNGGPAPKTPPHRPRHRADIAHSSVATSLSLSTLRSTKGSAYARSVANLGLQVAQALDYAHRAGIVHRDIKPANLLLDSKGTLWITDFGLAQFYSETNITRTGDLVGTMRYMSPEQASGRAVVLDQRTDIYSLGVTLYELLTLQRAFAGTTHPQLLDQIANIDPPLARSVDKTIPRELEIILAKAMAKDPADRYQSADLLAADLQRFLRDEPIHARPPSAWDKAIKWTRRHRALAISSVAILVLATIGLLISNFLIAREQGHTKTAYELEAKKATEAEQQRARAESSRQARDAVDFFSRMAESMNGPQYDDIRREMLAESLSYYQSFLEDRSEDQSINAELDAAKNRIGALLSKFLALDAMIRTEQRVRLLTQPSVLDDLKISATDAKKVSTEIDTKLGGKLPDTRDLAPEEELEVFTSRTNQMQSILNEHLGPVGAQRLMQIQRQVRGPGAFADADVVDQLRLNREQRINIRKLQSQVRHAPFRGGPFQQNPDDFQKLLDDANKKILAQLDDQQRTTWGYLIGPKFAGKVQMGGFDGRGGGRGQGNREGFGPGGRDGPGREGPGPRRDAPGGPGDGPPNQGGPRRGQ